jgi:hypothetical protein
LSKDKIPKEEDLQAISSYLSQLEDSANLQSDVIRVTKVQRVLTEILKLDVILGGPEFQFKSRFERLFERCNKALEPEKIADNTKQPTVPLENSATEDACSTVETKRPIPNTRTGKAYFQYSPAVLTLLVSNASLSLKVGDNSQSKRKRQIKGHVVGKNKRLRKTRKSELFLA